MGKTLEETIAARRLEETYSVSRLDGERLIDVWPAICHELDRIPQHWADRWTKQSMLDGAMTGRFQVWAVGPPHEFNFVVITQVASFPVCDILQVVLGFGHNMLQGLPVLVATLQKFATVQGCARWEVEGRQGWERVLSDYGFKRDRVVLSGLVPNMRMN